MPRTRRQAFGGYAYHVINRGVGRMKLFDDDGDFAAFERVLAQTQALVPMRLLAWCVMPNHWHLVLWPDEDGQLGRFMQRLTVTHVRRWQEYRGDVGSGHVYQGRYKSFPIQEDDHLLSVCRYVERNALRSSLVDQAEDWRWGSLWHWANREKLPGVPGLAGVEPEELPTLSDWPLPGSGAGNRPLNWVWRVNQPESEAELEALRRSVKRGQPYGSAGWSQDVAKAMGLESTYRDRGRPKKQP